MEHVKSIFVALRHLINNALLWCLKTYVKNQLHFDRKVLKRYLGIETPFYRMWHTQHIQTMQRKLEHSAKEREGYELGMII